MTVGIDDDLWSAIGDPTRRRLLDLLVAGDGGTATTLSEQLPVTRQAVAKHLNVSVVVGRGSEVDFDCSKVNCSEVASK